LRSFADVHDALTARGVEHEIVQLSSSSRESGARAVTLARGREVRAADLERLLDARVAPISLRD
jgi:hypothetical protein